MSGFPNDLQTDLTKLMKLLDEAGLCAPFSEVDDTTKAASKALKDCDEAVWIAAAKFKKWQEHFGFAPAKLSGVLSALAAAAAGLHAAHVEAMKICHDKGYKVFDGGGK